MKRQSSRASFLYTKKEKSLYSAGSAVTKKLGESVAAVGSFLFFTLSCTVVYHNLLLVFMLNFSIFGFCKIISLHVLMFHTVKHI